MKLTTVLKELLNEASYNYHVGNLGDGEVAPHGSDNIVTMRGRGTGHFGSGVYFSTYNCQGWGDKRDYEDNYGSNSDYEWNKNRSQKLSKVASNLYRVDFDIYKNLYRVNSETKGDYLFQTLKMINNVFYASFEDLLEDNTIPAWLGSKYLVLKNNLSRLGLDIPPYKQFIQLIKEAGKDHQNLRKEKEGKRASMSTRIMEYNNFNGVNVSGVPKYDNTTHGSVIYDMSKIPQGDITKAKDVSIYCTRIKNGVIGDAFDIKTDLLGGDKINSYNLTREINKLPVKDQILIFKRYNRFIERYVFNELSELQRKIYLNTLSYKIQKEIIDDIPSEKELSPIVDNKLEVIYNSKNVIEGKSLLFITLNDLYRFDEPQIEKIIKNINRPLSKEENETLSRFIEDNKDYYSWMSVLK